MHASRHEWGLTQAQMAARCGMSAKHYGQIERGDVEVTLSALERLAQGFDCELVELLAQVAEPHNGSARPTLDLRTWQEIREVMRLISDYAAQMLVHAGRARAGSEPVTNAAIKMDRVAGARPATADSRASTHPRVSSGGCGGSSLPTCAGAD
jgi:transcriptional regulator with XRE-family HTH domain